MCHAWYSSCMTTPQVEVLPAAPATCPRDGIEVVWTADGAEKYACTCEICTEVPGTTFRQRPDVVSRGFTRAMLAATPDEEEW
jgi:hypothetical protein